MADQNEKISEMLTLVTVFFHNTPNNTHKTNNNHKVQALVTEQKKSTRYSKMSFRIKLVKPQFLGFLTFIK